MNRRARVEDLNRAIAMGRKLEAMPEFYADRVRVQENLSPVAYGLPASMEREQRFLASIREWRGFTVRAVTVEGSLSFVDGVAHFVTADGEVMSRDQVAVARWNGEKIVEESVYFDQPTRVRAGAEVTV